MTRPKLGLNTASWKRSVHRYLLGRGLTAAKVGYIKRTRRGVAIFCKRSRLAVVEGMTPTPGRWQLDVDLRERMSGVKSGAAIMVKPA